MKGFSANLIRTLVKRESNWVLQKIESFRDKKIVLFPAGITAQAFYLYLKKEYEIEAEFFIDNDPALDGKIICGKPVKTRIWENMDFSEYIVLIPTAARYYMQIAEQLEESGVSTFVHADAFQACQLFERYDAVARMLFDEQSQIAFWGAIYGLLTCDYSFIRQEGEAYFALAEFSYCGHEIIVDVGAFVGDTTEEYVRHGAYGNNMKIYAFEPFEEAQRKLITRVVRLKKEWPLKDDDIVVVSAGVGAETGTLSFSANALNMLTPHELGDYKVPIYKLDDYFTEKSPFTLLKADVEGGEMDVLRGAEAMVRQHKPKLALSIYHSPQDFFRIAECVKRFVPEYRMYVRNHSYDHTDTVLYCVV